METQILLNELDPEQQKKVEELLIKDNWLKQYEESIVIGEREILKAFIEPKSIILEKLGIGYNQISNRLKSLSANVIRGDLLKETIDKDLNLLEKLNITHKQIGIN